MADATPSLRDQGRQALQAGNLDAAIDVLARAVMADDADSAAKMLLGIAYSMKGLHTQAKRALQGAVEREPQNADYRFNLGMVLEKSGDAPGAAQAFRETLQINPQHPQARARLQALGPQAGGVPPAAPSAYGSPPAAPPPPSAYGAPPPAASPLAPPPPPYGAPPAYAQPPAASPPPPIPQMGQPPIGSPLSAPPSAYGQPPLGQAPLGQAPLGGLPPIGGSPLGGPPLGGPPLGGPPPGPASGFGAMEPPPGTAQCPRCGQFSRLGMLCEFCSAPMPPPAPRPAAGMDPAAFGSTGPAPGYVAAPPEDTFEIRGGFAHLGQVLISPKAVFAEQAGREGFKEPGAFIMAWCLVHYAISFLFNIVKGIGGVNVGGWMCGFSCAYLSTWLFVMGGMFVWAGLLHGVSRMFGGQGSYSGSFRVAAYGAAPFLLAFTLGMVTVNLMTPSPAALRNNAAAPAPSPSVAAAATPLSQQISLAQFSPPGGPGMPSPPRYPYGGPSGGFGSPGAPGGMGAPNSNARIAALKEFWQGLQSAVPIGVMILCLGFLWSTALLAIGISEVHGVGIGAAAAAAIIPALLMGAILGGVGFVAWNALAGFMNQLTSGGFPPPGGRRF